MAQVRAVRVLRFIMTAEKNTAAANRDVPLAASVTVTWKYGTTYSASSTTTARATTPT